MEQHKIDANEKFFRDILRMLTNNGIWFWTAEMVPFRKVDNKLTTSDSEGYYKVKDIVSEKFFKEYFTLEK